MYDVNFHFDPMCPFAWQTSRWATRVAEITGISIHWSFISLKFLNEGKSPEELPPHYGESTARGQRLLRIAAALRSRPEADGGGNTGVGHFYTAIGESQWYEPAPAGASLFEVLANATPVETILERAGLDPELAAEGDNTAHDVLIRAETEAVLALTGRDVGTPILQFDPPHGNALFGPVISAVPDDEQAVALWNAAASAARVSSFSEFKRSKRDPLDLPLFANF